MYAPTRPMRFLAFHGLDTTSRLFLLGLLLSFIACQDTPSADDFFAQLKDGEAHFAIQLDGQPFYPDNSRFKGEVTAATDRFRLNITDQYESNVIVTLDTQGLFDKKPVQRTIDIQHQTAGSVLIGRIQDKARRTGEGWLMTEGTLTIEALSDERLVIRLNGKASNFNTLQNRDSYRPLTGLLVYRRPTINVPTNLKKTLLYQ